MDTSYPKDLDAILASLETLHPTDQHDVKDILAQRAAVLLKGIEPDEDLFTKILSTRRADLLTFLKGHPAPDFFIRKNWIKDFLQATEKDFFSALQKDFQDILISTSDLAVIAAQNGWTTLFERTAQKGFLSNIQSLVCAITQCHPDTAAQLAQFLHTHTSFVQNAHATKDIYLLFPDDIKVVAVFMKLGITIQQKTLAFKENHPIDPLLEKSKTAHGKIFLMDQESSLEDMLARPADAPFYGHTNGRINKT